MVQQPRSFLYYGFTSVVELNSDESTNARFESSPVHPRLSPVDLFEAATVNNAVALGLIDEVGTIEPGKRADLLLLRDNPLDSVRALDSIDLIFIDGNLIERSSLSASGTSTAGLARE